MSTEENGANVRSLRSSDSESTRKEPEMGKVVVDLTVSLDGSSPGATMAPIFRWAVAESVCSRG
jgi:hypothetical protein